jgi:hypothetical protein
MPRLYRHRREGKLLQRHVVKDRGETGREAERFVHADSIAQDNGRGKCFLFVPACFRAEPPHPLT